MAQIKKILRLHSKPHLSKVFTHGKNAQNIPIKENFYIKRHAFSLIYFYIFIIIFTHYPF